MVIAGLENKTLFATLLNVGLHHWEQSLGPAFVRNAPETMFKWDC